MAGGPIRVEARGYVPFEPRAEEPRRLRAELKARLSRLSAEKGQILGARFFGPLPRGADVENALLYNIDVGGRAFAAASRFGVRFEHDPDALRDGGVRYEYGLEADDAGFRIWKPTARLAGVDVKLEATPTLAAIWWALRERGTIQGDAPRRLPGEPFAVSLRLSGPTNGARPALVKILIDGVVCALQSQTDAQGVDAVAPLIASSLGAPVERVRRHLLDDRPSILGTRPRLVHRRASGVQWAPDDDACVAGEVLIEPAAQWRIGGEVHVVARRRAG